MYSSIFTYPKDIPNLYLEILIPVHGIDTALYFLLEVNDIWLELFILPS